MQQEMHSTWGTEKDMEAREGVGQGVVGVPCRPPWQACCQQAHCPLSTCHLTLQRPVDSKWLCLHQCTLNSAMRLQFNVAAHIDVTGVNQYVVLAVIIRKHTVSCILRVTYTYYVWGNTGCACGLCC